MYKQIIKPIFFLFDPEKIHHFVFKTLKIIGQIPFVSSITRAMFKVDKKELGVKLFGLHFPNRVGLAAGFDKDAKLFDELGDLGFGFVEIGTLTPVGQEGNPKPRLFRLPKDEALINRMGFNNQGVDAAVERLKKKRKSDLIIGGNIGKNKITPNDEAVKDYEICFEKLFDHVDYFVVNVSSPNTPNLRELQDKEPLSKLLNRLQELNKAKNHPKPILLKIAPDLNLEQLNDIVDIYKDTQLAGLIVANTTLDRSNLKSPQTLLDDIGSGGLSGKPVKDKSTQIIKHLKAKGGPEMKIIAVGGIHSEEDAMEKLEAGADLIQLYTGFIYEGPALVKRINDRLLKGIN